LLGLGLGLGAFLMLFVLFVLLIHSADCWNSFIVDFCFGKKRIFAKLLQTDDIHH